MSLETVERIKKQTQELKKQAQELIGQAYQYGAEEMKKQEQDLIDQAVDQAYQRGFKAWRESGFNDWKKTFDNTNALIEQGRDEAWKVAKRLVSAGYKECNEILGDGVLEIESVDDVFVRCTASEAIEKIKAYEEKKREEEETSDLHIGDEVTFLTIGGEIITGVITGEYHDTHEFRIMRATDGGECYCCKAKRTGRHFPEIAEVLKKMKEGDNCCMSNSDLMRRYPDAMEDKENAE